jgi:RNA polymerase sigma factor (sigma-70 family)
MGAAGEDILATVRRIVAANYARWPSADQDDLVQDVVERYLDSWPGTAEPYNVEAWINRVVRNRAVDIDRGRHKDRHAVVDDVEATLDGMRVFAANGPSQQSASEIMLAEILEPLPPREREMFRRRYLGNESSRLIASDLGITVNAVDKAAQHARRRIRDQFAAAPELLAEFERAFPRKY